MTEKVFGSEKQGSIHDIPLPQSSGESVLDLKSAKVDPKLSGDDWKVAKRKNKRFGTKLSIFLLCFIAGFLVYSYLFHSADLVVKAKTEKVQLLNEQIKLSNDESDALSYIKTNLFTKSNSVYVQGSIQENRQTKSSGVITVYNTSNKEKNYIKNTRFQTEDGRIYRAFKRFTIPKGTVDKPGEAQVQVVAENPGQKYNSDSGLSFTLPALKEQGDPAYKQVYASQNEKIAGGYSGVVTVPTEDDIKEEKIRLLEKTKQDILVDLRKTLPEKYIVDNKLVFFQNELFTQQPNESKGGVDLELSLGAQAIVFENEKLTTFLLNKATGQTGETGAQITNPEGLNFKSENSTIDEIEKNALQVTGEAIIQWPQNATNVSQAVAGKLRSHVENGLVSGLKNVEVESISIHPFWRRSLPESADQIEIEFKD